MLNTIIVVKVKGHGSCDPNRVSDRRNSKIWFSLFSYGKGFSLKKMFLSQLPAVFALGVVSQVVQIVLLRELLMVFHGNELSLGIILAAWMLWVGIGSHLGSKIARRSIKPVTIVSIISAASVIFFVFTVFSIRMLRFFFTIETGAYFSVSDMTLSCLIVIAPVGLLLGIQFVMLAKVWRENDKAHDTSAAEKTYIGEASGNIIGGILFSFFLVHLFNSFHAVVFAGFLMVAATLLLVLKCRHEGLSMAASIKPALFMVMIGSVVFFLFLGPLDKWTYTLQWKFFSPEYLLVETRQSKYGTISVVQREDQYSFFQSGNLIFSTAGPVVESPALEEQEAVIFAHFAMVQHPAPEHVLLIGGGLRGTIREIAKHPVKHIDYVELDPVLTDMARPYIPRSTIRAIDSPLVNLIHTDGRLFIKKTDQTYDMIIADIPDPSTAVINRYYTEEFFREVKSRLNPGGVFVTGAMTTPDMRGEAAANRNTAIYHTLKRVFPNVLPAGQRFIFFFASHQQGQVSADISILRQRYIKRQINTDGFSHRHFDLLLEESQLRRINWIIRNHGRNPDAHLGNPESGPLFPPSIEEQEIMETKLPPVNERFFINSDFKPIGYYYTLRFWDVLAGGNHRDTFKWILRVQPWWIAPVFAFCIVFPLVIKCVPTLKKNRADRHFAILLAVFSTGLSTMALQVAIIFSFQSLYGFVYEMIGLITALFMGGLAIGTFVSRNLVREKSSITILAGIQFLIALFAMVIAFGLPGAAKLEFPFIVVALFSAMTFLAGIFNGADFPISVACCQSLSKDPEKATGTVYGVELFGACAGALVASVVIAPVLGITAVCILAAIANFTAFLVLVISGAWQ